MFPDLKIQLPSKMFLKDPDTSELGRRIIANSITLIDELGFEHFTFKKLGERIGSNESSIYRYFESKHRLLVYLSAWYWGWMDNRLVLATTNVDDAWERLRRAVTILTGPIEDDLSTWHINEKVLNRIIVLEFTKTFLTKEVDEENKEGFFLIYKRVINRLIAIIKEVNPDFLYAKSLASAVVEGALHQHFLSGHLKTITDCDTKTTPTDFYIYLLKNTLNR